ncbi:hypothetical protein C8F01DRAFT_694019 [Mycena amicta]|nr:hypothetical protein C8F01DRAFT_694019 [Mycena amicta]
MAWAPTATPPTKATLGRNQGFLRPSSSRGPKPVRSIISFLEDPADEVVNCGKALRAPMRMDANLLVAFVDHYGNSGPSAARGESDAFKLPLHPIRLILDRLPQIPTQPHVSLPRMYKSCPAPPTLLSLRPQPPHTVTNMPFTNNAGIPRLHARPRTTRSRSSSISVIVNQAATCLIGRKEEITTKPAVAAAPEYRQFIGPPRKPSLKTGPTGFEPNLPQTDSLSNEESSSASEPGADDDEATTSSESASLSSTEESCPSASDSEEVMGAVHDDSSSFSSLKGLLLVTITRAKLVLRRRSRAAHNHAHPRPRGVRLIPQFSQPGCRLEPVSACVEHEVVEDDVCDRVRFVVPDDTHLRHSLDEEEPEENKFEEPTWGSW